MVSGIRPGGYREVLLIQIEQMKDGDVYGL